MIPHLLQVPATITDYRKLISPAISILHLHGPVLLSDHLGRKFSGISTPSLTFLIAILLKSLFPSLAIHSQTKDIIWTHFIQAALCLGIWSMNEVDGAGKRDNYFSILIPFILGTLGTFTASLVSFSFVTKVFNLRCVWSFAIAISCLCSSYIGGTANFFEVATILSDKVHDNNLVDSIELNSLLSTVAATDVAIMCGYFSVLSWMQSRTQFQNLFKENKIFPGTASNPRIYNDSGAFFSQDTIENRDGISRFSSNKTSIVLQTRRAALITFAFTTTLTSQLLQRVIPRPGFAVITTTALSLLARPFLYRLPFLFQPSACSTTSTSNHTLNREISPSASNSLSSLSASKSYR